MPRAEVHKLMERMAIPAIAAPMFLVSNPALTLACCGEGLHSHAIGFPLILP